MIIMQIDLILMFHGLISYVIDQFSDPDFIKSYYWWIKLVLLGGIHTFKKLKVWKQSTRSSRTYEREH